MLFDGGSSGRYRTKARDKARRWLALPSVSSA